MTQSVCSKDKLSVSIIDATDGSCVECHVDALMSPAEVSFDSFVLAAVESWIRCLRQFPNSVDM